MNISRSNIAKIKALRLIVFDFDGVFTNNKVFVNENGIESVICNRFDGIGLSKLREIGVGSMILSTETNNVVLERARKLNIECFQGCKNKFSKLLEIVKKTDIPLQNIAFMGNDINDAECLKNVGLPILVSDAHEDVKSLGKIFSRKKGGEGAVREICDLIYDIQKGMNRCKKRLRINHLKAR